MKKFTFDRDYRCGVCGCTEIKLWREYQTIADQTSLLCASCAHATQNASPHTSYNKDEKRPYFDFSDGDQIGWMVPAVPTEDGATFYGYTSVPSERVLWWLELPTYKDNEREIATLRSQFISLKRRELRRMEQRS